MLGVGFGIMFLLFMLFIIIFIIFFKTSPRNTYYILVILGSLVGMIISYGISINTFIESKFFSYQGINCEQNKGLYFSKKQCIDSNEKFSQTQQIEDSKTILMGLVRGLIFAGVYSFHYKELKNN